MDKLTISITKRGSTYVISVNGPMGEHPVVYRGCMGNVIEYIAETVQEITLRFNEVEIEVNWNV